MDRGAWWAAVCGMAESQTWPRDWAQHSVTRGDGSGGGWEGEVHTHRHTHTHTHTGVCEFWARLSVVSDFVTPWTVARQASLSFTNSQSCLRLMSVKSVMPSNHLILCRPLLFPPSVFPSIKVFSSQFFPSGDQSIGVSASASVLPMNIQGWFPLR